MLGELGGQRRLFGLKLLLPLQEGLEDGAVLRVAHTRHKLRLLLLQAAQSLVHGREGGGRYLLHAAAAGALGLESSHLALRQLQLALFEAHLHKN